MIHIDIKTKKKVVAFSELDEGEYFMLDNDEQICLKKRHVSVHPVLYTDNFLARVICLHDGKSYHLSDFNRVTPVKLLGLQVEEL